MHILCALVLLEFSQLVFWEPFKSALNVSLITSEGSPYK